VHYFSKYYHKYDVLENIYQDITENNFDFKYPYAEKFTEVATGVGNSYVNR